MEPELTLVIVSAITLLVGKFTGKGYRWALSARAGMSAMMVVTGIAHFVFTKGMAMMLPDVIPFREMLVYLTGVLELAAAVGLLLPRSRKLTAWCLIAFFVVITPANIYAAMEHIDMAQASYNGSGPAYLWYRIPLQLFYIAWVYLSAIHQPAFLNRVATR